MKLKKLKAFRHGTGPLDPLFITSETKTKAKTVLNKDVLAGLSL